MRRQCHFREPGEGEGGGGLKFWTPESAYQSYHQVPGHTGDRRWKVLQKQGFSQGAYYVHNMPHPVSQARDAHNLGYRVLPVHRVNPSGTGEVGCGNLDMICSQLIELSRNCRAYAFNFYLK